MTRTATRPRRSRQQGGWRQVPAARPRGQTGARAGRTCSEPRDPLLPAAAAVAALHPRCCRRGCRNSCRAASCRRRRSCRAACPSRPSSSMGQQAACRHHRLSSALRRPLRPSSSSSSHGSAQAGHTCSHHHFPRCHWMGHQVIHCCTLALHVCKCGCMVALGVQEKVSVRRSACSGKGSISASDFLACVLGACMQVSAMAAAASSATGST